MSFSSWVLTVGSRPQPKSLIVKPPQIAPAAAGPLSRATLLVPALAFFHAYPSLPLPTSAYMVCLLSQSLSFGQGLPWKLCSGVLQRAKDRIHVHSCIPCWSGTNSLTLPYTHVAQSEACPVRSCSVNQAHFEAHVQHARCRFCRSLMRTCGGLEGEEA